MRQLIVGTVFCLTATVAGAQSIAARVASSEDRALLTALVAREDSRQPYSAASGDDPRVRGLSSRNPFIRAFTVRGLGRLEQIAAGEVIGSLLADPSGEVRAAAADALAQSVARPLTAAATAAERQASADAIARARAVLTDVLSRDKDAEVRASLLESIGRLPQGTVDQVKATASIIAPSLSATSVVERRGAIRGTFFLARKREARTAGVIPSTVTDRLYAMLLEPASAGYTPTDRFNLAFALAGAVALNEERAAVLSADRDPYVRDRAMISLARSTDTARIRGLLARGMSDPAPVVRFRALNVYAQKLRATGCQPLVTLTRDTDMTVAIGATDALSGCRNDPAVARHLASVASGFRDDDAWHLPTHAFVALTAVDSAAARQMLPRFMAAQNFFVRMYADTAARLLGDVASLHVLSRDAHANVQASAIVGLSRLVGHAADSVYVRALASDDNQVLMAATAGLKGSTWPGLSDAVAKRFNDRLARGWQTDRDGHDALLELAQALGTQVRSRDDHWLRAPLPTFDDLAALERSTARIEMMDGSVITMRFHAFEAPTNGARFARLARAGAFDGLTFHRVAPFFVVQGPGPHANEYSAPDKPFTRDELGVSNVRGTVGLSTRGRDTADGQIYFNTVDNVWLDHEYTVMATVMSGFDAVERMQEGARIRRVTITP